MQKADLLIRTKLHLPFTRPGLVARPRLLEQITLGLRGPLTLVTAPAGFGKTTLVAACVAGCGLPVGWLSLDQNDNQAERFLSYLLAALREADPTLAGEAVQLLGAAQQIPPEMLLTSLINDLDISGRQIVLVLDDYQFINSQAVHEQMTFLIEHCPATLHLVIATRSDPPLPLARLRARGHTLELRTADLRFSESEAAQFLNDIMGLHLDAKSVAVLAGRTEGWIAGLQMAALSMRERADVIGFIESFSGTNRYILDYLLEEVLANQPPEIQYFLHCTSILERLTAPLCDTILANCTASTGGGAGRLFPASFTSSRSSASILEYLEHANLFLVPLDDERIWFRYHHLFADLLRKQLHKSIGDQGVANAHLFASQWYEQAGSILDAIHHASLASDTARIERLIEQNYIEMMNHGEMSWVRYWMGKLSKELVTRRPWLCLYEALSRSWFGQLDEATLLLDQAEKLIRSEPSAPDVQTMLGYHSYVKSRVTAMKGDTRRAIELCMHARQTIPADNLGLQIDVSITLGYVYFLYGDFVNATQILSEMIRSGTNAGAINNPVAGYAVLARMHAYQGRLHQAAGLLGQATQLIHGTGSQYLGVNSLIDVGSAALACEWNDLQGAQELLVRGLESLPLWGKADDLCLAYITLARIQLAQGKQSEAASAIDKAAQLLQTCGVFSEARSTVRAARVRLWLVQEDWSSIERWSTALASRLDANPPFQYEDELSRIMLARVYIAQHKIEQALKLLSGLEAAARPAGRMGRLIEILILKALAHQALGDPDQAHESLVGSLVLAEPEGFTRIFMDEGRPMQSLLAQWLAHASSGPVRDYASRLLAQFDPAARWPAPTRAKAFSSESLIEPLSQRELEVLHLIALGRTNQEIARQLVVAPGTVKAHTASIYRKLDAGNRTEAVARARQLGVLS